MEHIRIGVLYSALYGLHLIERRKKYQKSERHLINHSLMLTLSLTRQPQFRHQYIFFYFVHYTKQKSSQNFVK